MKILTFLLCFFLTLPTFSVELSAGKLSYLEINQPAPYSGYLVNQKKMDHFREINETLKLYQEKSMKLEMLLKITETEITYYKDNLEKTREELEKEQRVNNVKVYLAFGAGITLTLGIGWIILWLIP